MIRSYFLEQEKWYLQISLSKESDNFLFTMIILSHLFLKCILSSLFSNNSFSYSLPNINVNENFNRQKIQRIANILDVNNEFQIKANWCSTFSMIKSKMDTWGKIFYVKTKEPLVVGQVVGPVVEVGQVVEPFLQFQTAEHYCVTDVTFLLR